MASEGVVLHRDFWYVQRLLFIAMKKESTSECPLSMTSRCPGFVIMITNFLCTPLYVLAHPRAYEGCHICCTPICAACQRNHLSCRCGANVLRTHGGRIDRMLPCGHSHKNACYNCSAIVHSRSAARCSRCETEFRPIVFAPDET